LLGLLVSSSRGGWIELIKFWQETCFLEKLTKRTDWFITKQIYFSNYTCTFIKLNKQISFRINVLNFQPYTKQIMSKVLSNTCRSDCQRFKKQGVQSQIYRNCYWKEFEFWNQLFRRFYYLLQLASIHWFNDFLSTQEFHTILKNTIWSNLETIDSILNKQILSRRVYQLFQLSRRDRGTHRFILVHSIRATSNLTLHQGDFH